MTNLRDLENLSAYLDGQLDSKESTRLESRLKSDPELESALRDLRSARGILRQLPSRKAPRNFTLTRQMAGLKPPLPRSYPLIRFATVFAAVLFLFSFTANALTPMFSLSFGAAAPAPVGGMGGGCEEPCGEAAVAEEPLVEMAPAATEEALAQDSTPATEAPPSEMLPSAAPTSMPETPPADTNRIVEPTPSPKEGETQPSAENPAGETADQPEVPPEPLPSFNWTMLFLILSVAGGIVLLAMRQSAKRKWR